jgi:hypothetical protein
MKKSQISMNEVIVVMFIFFVILLIGLIFYFKSQVSSVKSDIESVSDTELKNIMDKVTAMPELRCSQEEFKDDVCFDYNSFMSFKAFAGAEENKAYYFGLFKNSRIRLEYLGGEVSVSGLFGTSYDSFGVNCVAASNIQSPVCFIYDGSSGQGFAEKRSLFTPVIIYDSGKKASGYGILTVEAGK